MEDSNAIKIDKIKMDAISNILDIVDGYNYYVTSDISEEEKQVMIGILDRKFAVYFRRLKNRGLNTKEDFKTIEDFLATNKFDTFFEKYIEPKYIRDVPRIDMIMVDDIEMVLTDVLSFLEYPVQKPCFDLWEKGYTTYCSSANYLDLFPERKAKDGRYYATIGILDDIPQEILEGLKIRRNELGTLELFEPIYRTSTVSEVQNSFCQTIEALPVLKAPTKNKLTDFVELSKLYQLKGVDLSKFESLQDAIDSLVNQNEHSLVKAVEDRKEKQKQKKHSEKIMGN